MGGHYRIGNNPDKAGNAEWFGRYAVEGKANYDWNNLETQFRLRYTNFDDLGDDNDRSNYLRMKFQLEYEIGKTDIKPYALYELYRHLRLGEYTKARWEGGLKYKITKHHRIGAYFRLNDYLIDDDESVNDLHRNGLDLICGGNYRLSQRSISFVNNIQLLSFTQRALVA